MPGHVAAWRALVEDPDQSAPVRDHLASFPVRTEADRALLDRVMRRFRQAGIESSRLSLTFGDSVEVHASAPYGGPAGDIPPTVLDVIRVHNQFGWEDPGGGTNTFYGYDTDGRPAVGGYESWLLAECDEDGDFVTAAGAAGRKLDDVAAPFDAGQDWILWHPTDRNAHGEPTQWYLSHDGNDPDLIEDIHDLALGQVLLRRLADALDIHG